MKILFKKHWPLIGLGVLLAVVSFYLLRFDKGNTPETVIKDIMSGEGLMLKDVHFAQDNPEKGLLWSLDATEAISSGDKKSISFKGFHLEMRPKDKPITELTGGRGDYLRDTGDINLWGNIEAGYGDRFRLITEHLLINENRGEMSSDKPVKIIGPGFILEGQGMLVDLKKEICKVTSSVTATIEKEVVTK